DALDESQKKDDQFRDEQDQGGNQGGGQQNGRPRIIPPAAELKLLRQMQAEALALTKEAEGADAGLKSDASTEAGKVQEELARRDAEMLRKLQQGAGRPPPGGDEPGGGEERPGGGE